MIWLLCWLLCLVLIAFGLLGACWLALWIVLGFVGLPDFELGLVSFGFLALVFFAMIVC